MTSSRERIIARGAGALDIFTRILGPLSRAPSGSRSAWLRVESALISSSAHAPRYGSTSIGLLRSICNKIVHALDKRLNSSKRRYILLHNYINTRTIVWCERKFDFASLMEYCVDYFANWNAVLQFSVKIFVEIMYLRIDTAYFAL